MQVNCAHTELVDVERLVLNPRNANKHPDKQIELLAKILKFQGWRHPVVVSKRSGFVVAGHGRIAAARLNGWTEVPVDYQDFENEAAEWAFEEFDPKGKTVVDLFGGSGSTLIACEKTQRQCFMMEMSEAYCDTIIARFEKFSGKKAELVNG